MNPLLILGIIIGYYLCLYGISLLTDRGSDENTFFTGNHSSPWHVVAFGMIGVALSGVTFASLPGTVVQNKFFYVQFLLGNLVGYFFITFVLIPLYFRYQLVSIYGYLKERFGTLAYKTGAAIFIISQSFGASLRLLLAMVILQHLIFDRLHVPLFIATYATLLLIWIYTRNSGIKTLVWTDLLQTFFLVGTVAVTIYMISSQLPTEVIAYHIRESPYMEFFSFDIKSKHNFFKQFVAGFFVTVAMMGLDQFMIQKSLTCRNVGDAMKNCLVFSITVFVVQVLFLFLGFFLIIFAQEKGIPIPEKTDQLFSTIATSPYLGKVVTVTFVLGLAAATFSSADSAITSLTTSFTYDFLDIESKPPAQKVKTKKITHVAFTIIIGAIVLLFSSSGQDVFTTLFLIAGYTYGPLLALFTLGIYSKISPWDKAVPLICVVSPFLTYGIQHWAKTSYNFDFSFLNIFLNAVLACIMLIISSRMKPSLA